MAYLRLFISMFVSVLPKSRLLLAYIAFNAAFASELVKTKSNVWAVSSAKKVSNLLLAIVVNDRLGCASKSSSGALYPLYMTTNKITGKSTISNIVNFIILLIHLNI